MARKIASNLSYMYNNTLKKIHYSIKICPKYKYKKKKNEHMLLVIWKVKIINHKTYEIQRKQKWKPVTLSCYSTFVQHLTSTLQIESTKINEEMKYVFNTIMKRYFLPQLKTERTYLHLRIALCGI